ncbi:hypothetical protein QJQ45_016218 [Haematococcus lacustris]|nr:hypothetical protein QJQ45_016218 [Haematococcus lacustris]
MSTAPGKSAQQPCEEQLDHEQPTRPADLKPPAGQMEHRLVHPAWSQQRDQPVQGLMCPALGYIAAMAKPAQRHAPSRVSELEVEAATIGLCSLETVRAAREERWSSQSRRPPSALGPPDTRAPTIFNTPNLSDSLHSVLRHRPASASPLHTTAAPCTPCTPLHPMLRQQQQQLAGSTAWLAQPSRAAVSGSGQASTPAAARQTSKSWSRPASAAALKSSQQCQPSSGGGGAADGAGWDVASRVDNPDPNPNPVLLHSVSPDGRQAYLSTPPAQHKGSHTICTTGAPQLRIQPLLQPPLLQPPLLQPPLLQPPLLQPTFLLQPASAVPAAADRPGLHPPPPALASFHSFKLPPQHQLQQHQNLRAAQRQQPAAQEQPYLPPSSSPSPTLQRPLPPRPTSSLKHSKAMSQGGALPLAVTPGPSPPAALAPTPTPAAGQPPLPRSSSSSRGRGAPPGGQALGLGGRLLPQWAVAGLQEHQLLQSQPPQFSPEEVTLTTSQTSHQRVRAAQQHRVRPSSSPPTHCPIPQGWGHPPGPPSVADPTPAISDNEQQQQRQQQQEQQQQQERRLSKHSSSGTGGGEGQAARSCLLPGGLDLPCLVPSAPLPALGSSSQGHSRPPSACRPGSGVREGGPPLAPASTSPPRPGSAASTRPGSALSSRVVGGEGGGGGSAADLARVSPWGLAALHQVPKGVPCVVDTEVDDQEVAVTLAIAEAQETGQAQLSDRAMQQLPAQARPQAAMQPLPDPPCFNLSYCCNHLTSLVLSRNALLSSPPLELTQSLTSLDLSYNSLTQLPSTLGLLLRLQQLVLDSNKLTALPDVCTQLTALTLISVSRLELEGSHRCVMSVTRLVQSPGWD